MNERRGFFDECHTGEIDPGYYWLYQNGNHVGEVWENPYQIEALFYATYSTPGKAGPVIDTKFSLQGRTSTGNVPPIASRIAALKGNQPFTHVRYSGVFVQVYP